MMTFEFESLDPNLRGRTPNQSCVMESRDPAWAPYYFRGCTYPDSVSVTWSVYQQYPSTKYLTETMEDLQSVNVQWTDTHMGEQSCWQLVRSQCGEPDYIILANKKSGKILTINSPTSSQLITVSSLPTPDQKHMCWKLTKVDELKSKEEMEEEEEEENNKKTTRKKQVIDS